MRPPKREFEQVAVDEWLKGEIVDVQYEQEHEFTFKGVKSVGPAAKILIQLDGYKDKKSTGWWSFNYSEKSNLYKFFIQPLVKNAAPNIDFDLDNLKNLRVKVMYTQAGEYQNLMAVRPADDKVLSSYTPPVEKAPNDDEVPF